MSSASDEDPGERAWKAKSEKAQARIADEPERKPKKRARKVGAASSVAVSAETAAAIEKLQAHYTKATGFAIDRIQVVARAVADLCDDLELDGAT